MSAVVVVGSANLDFTIQVDRPPQQGETIFGRDLLVSFGGKGANQAVAARRAGANVTFIGKVGQDRHGEETEASTLTGVPVRDREGAEKAGERLLEMGCGAVIITLGALGALWVGKDGARHFPAFSVRPVDSTAAGALATTRRGAQESLPGRTAIDAFLSSGQ
jgi:sugar/nucleoside kinase (ribokinase family)